jgi:hypothetical protein
MRTFRIPLLFMATLIMGFLVGRKSFTDGYPEAPDGDR